MRECAAILIVFLYLIPNLIRKTVPGSCPDLILGELLIPDNPIYHMKILDLLAWRRKELVNIVHIPHYLCILKGACLVGILNIIIYLLEVLI